MLLSATVFLELGSKPPNSYIHALSMTSKHVLLPGQLSDTATSSLLSQQRPQGLLSFSQLIQNRTILSSVLSLMVSGLVIT